MNISNIGLKGLIPPIWIILGVLGIMGTWTSNSYKIWHLRFLLNFHIICENYQYRIVGSGTNYMDQIVNFKNLGSWTCNSYDIYHMIFTLGHQFQMLFMTITNIGWQGLIPIPILDKYDFTPSLNVIYENWSEYLVYNTWYDRYVPTVIFELTLELLFRMK